MEAFFDESGKFHSGPVVVLCGVVGQYSDLDAFNPAWGSLLVKADLKCLAAKDAFRTKSALSSRIPAHSIDERINALKPFIEAIRHHLQMGVICAIDVESYRAAAKRVRHNFGSVDDPIYIAFVKATMELVKTIENSNDLIGMVCDDEEQTALPFYRYWRRLKKVDGAARKKLVNLSFADDEVFPALQAADLLSSLARLEARKRFHDEPYDFEPLYRMLDPEMPGPTDLLMKSAYWGAAEMKAIGDSFVELENK